MNYLAPVGAVASVRVTDVVVRLAEFVLSVQEWVAHAGSLIGLVGVNGAGKTTFIRAVAGNLPLAAGTVSVCGVPIDEYGWSAPVAVGFVSDHPIALEEFGLSRNLQLLSASYDSWDGEYATQLADRLKVPLTKPLKALSHGTRIKAQFVMAEAPRPAVLLLDEPTSGLDPIVRLELLNALVEGLERNPSRVVVFSTHILEDIAHVATAVSLVRRGTVYNPRSGLSLTRWRQSPAGTGAQQLAELFDVPSFD